MATEYKHWRYQAVYRTGKIGRLYTLCECFLDENGKLMKWTESPAVEPSGETLDEMRNDLRQMLADSKNWKPVKFEDLQIGMSFELEVAP